MKLVYCPTCKDIFNLTVDVKTCSCNCSGGYYTDNINAKLYGNAVPIGFLNSEFVDAINNQPESQDGKIFTAFVIPKKAPTISYKKT